MGTTTICMTPNPMSDAERCFDCQGTRFCGAEHGQGHDHTQQAVNCTAAKLQAEKDAAAAQATLNLQILRDALADEPPYELAMKPDNLAHHVQECIRITAQVNEETDGCFFPYWEGSAPFAKLGTGSDCEPEGVHVWYRAIDPTDHEHGRWWLADNGRGGVLVATALMAKLIP